ncbi:4-alpha-glucanotransferase, partial [Klebsiella pneumoniae]|uniref:4-alpha-glucanotransferase n=1 Tax=Klebsiella pneumoniae TaxID=573 RepID=UPI00358ECACE
RLWWWPAEAENQIETGAETESGEPEGAYVYYPFDTLLASLLLESQRARCLVIGEDLGLVPPQIVAPLKLGGLYSNELF